MRSELIQSATNLRSVTQTRGWKLVEMVYFFFRSIVYSVLPTKTLMKDVSGQVVLITGGGMGLGRILGQKFSRLGCKIVIWDISQTLMEETTAMIRDEGGEAFHYLVDVSDADQVNAAAFRVTQEVGHPDIVIMNAGIVSGKKILNLTNQDIERCFKVNTLSHFWITRAFLPWMIKTNSGHLVSIDSVTSYFGTSSLTDYSASKAASHRLQESLTFELKYDGYDGIRVTSVMPYFIKTGMFDGSSSIFLDMLEPEYVAQKALEGILTNRSTVFIPGIFYFLRSASLSVPFKCYFAFHEFFFGGDMMSGFHGRGPKPRQDSDRDSGINDDDFSENRVEYDSSRSPSSSKNNNILTKRSPEQEISLTPWKLNMSLWFLDNHHIMTRISH